MLRFFRTIRKKLIEHPSMGRSRDNVRKYLLYAIGEFLLMVVGHTCPVRDYIRVYTMDSPNAYRAVRLRPPTGWYRICLKSDVATKHIEELW